MLDFILEFGLLLSHEYLPLCGQGEPVAGEPVKGGAQRNEFEPLTIEQRRACFTLRAFDQLSAPRPIGSERVSHFDLFGRFAIAIDPSRARSIGLMPVHYFYRGDQSEGELGDLGGLLVNYLTQIRELLTFVAYSERERKIRQNGFDSLLAVERDYERDGLVPQLALPVYRERIEAAIKAATPEQLAYVEQIIKFDRFHIGRMADSINMLLANYQTADSSSFKARYMYYFQQEWRLISTFNSKAILFDMAWTDHPNPDVQSVVCEAQVLMQRIAEMASLPAPRNDVLLLHGYQDPPIPFREMISAVVCPRVAAREVEDILRDHRVSSVALLTTD